MARRPTGADDWFTPGMPVAPYNWCGAEDVPADSRERLRRVVQGEAADEEAALGERAKTESRGALKALHIIAQQRAHMEQVGGPHSSAPAAAAAYERSEAGGCFLRRCWHRCCRRQTCLRLVQSFATKWLPFALIWAGVAVAASLYPHKHWQEGACRSGQDGTLHELLDKWLSGSAVGSRLLMTIGSGVAAQSVKCIWSNERLKQLTQRCVEVQHQNGLDDAEEVMIVARTPEAERTEVGPDVDKLIKRLKENAAKGFLMTLVTGHGVKRAKEGTASWLEITDESTAQMTWGQARNRLGLTPCRAVLVGATKLVFWHFSQPTAYLIIFGAYYCQLSNVQQQWGSVVAAREVIYLATACAAAFACPVYLLLDLEAVWQTSTWGQRVVRLAMYILAPQNYVALCLNCRFAAASSDEISGADGAAADLLCASTDATAEWKRVRHSACFGFLLTWLAGGVATGIAYPGAVAGCVGSITWAMAGAWSFGLVALYEAGVRRHFKFSIGGQSVEAHIFGAVALAACISGVVAAGPVIWQWLPDSRARQPDSAPVSSSSGLIEDDEGADELGWDAAGIGATSVFGFCVGSGVIALFVEAKICRGLKISPTKLLFFGLAGVQVAADFASCFALAQLLAESMTTNNVDYVSPFALKIGYSITTAGFLLFLGPLSIIESFHAAGIKRHSRCRFRCVDTGKSTCTQILAGFGGVSLLVGFVYILVLVVLFWSGWSDIWCHGFPSIGQSAASLGCVNGHTWSNGTTNGCLVGSCACSTGYSGRHCETECFGHGTVAQATNDSSTRCACEFGYSSSSQCQQCPPGFLGEHCAGTFTIYGTHNSSFSGSYTKTNIECDGTTVFQKGDWMLYKYTGIADWLVYSSKGTTPFCGRTADGYIPQGTVLASSNTDNYASPDSSPCAGRWKEISEGLPRKLISPGSRMYENPSLKVVAAWGKACVTFQPDCGHGACVANGDGAHDYRCGCNYGWSGARCDHDPCGGSSPCGAHGSCDRDGDGLGYSCSCDACWSGRRCTNFGQWNLTVMVRWNQTVPDPTQPCRPVSPTEFTYPRTYAVSPMRPNHTFEAAADRWTEGKDDLSAVGGYKYCGGVLLPDGRVLLVPDYAKHVGLYDPSADAWTEGKDDLSAVGGDDKYHG
eukprot:COSAG01_NODE_3627_length_5854_cov_2.571304_6_plen_1138_part_01